MPNIAALLRSEISRLSRREIRKEVQPLRKAAAAHRREIAALKRLIASLDRRARAWAKTAAARGSDTAVADGRRVRFVAKGLTSLRKRLGLSASELARLLGVSMQSVYNWEHKKAAPRREQVTAIVALRSIGKQEARKRLDALPNAKSKRRKRATVRVSR